jgi:Zn-finger nucleic acid-binding protein
MSEEGGAMTRARLKCPREGVALEKHVYEGQVEVDLCPSCRGMWLEKGELEKIQQTKGHDYSAELARIEDLAGNAYELARQKKGARVGCPVCGREMVAKEYGYCSQVLIDSCPHCWGIWLDAGEVQALEVFFERCSVDTAEIRRGFWGSLKGFFG